MYNVYVSGEVNTEAITAWKYTILKQTPKHSTLNNVTYLIYFQSIQTKNRYIYT